MVAEVLRSGAFSDEVVVNLVRRRFVAVMYDTAEPGSNFGDAWAFDADAVAAIGPISQLRSGHDPRGGLQDLDGRVRADSYPAALFLLPDGTQLGDGAWGILAPEPMVEALKAVIARWPEHFPPTSEERATLRGADEHPDDPSAQLEAARLHWELAQFEEVLHRADAGLAGASVSSETLGELQYLRGRALACLHRDPESRAALVSAQPHATGEVATAVELALARLEMHDGRFEAALQHLLPIVEFTRPGIWTGAAAYYSGLCHHRLGREDDARFLWRRHRSELPFDRLARRSAASLGLGEAQAFLNQELVETSGWW